MTPLTDILKRARRRMQVWKADDQSGGVRHKVTKESATVTRQSPVLIPRGADDHYVRRNSPSRLLGWH